MAWRRQPSLPDSNIHCMLSQTCASTLFRVASCLAFPSLCNSTQSSLAFQRHLGPYFHVSNTDCRRSINLLMPSTVSEPSAHDRHSIDIMVPCISTHCPSSKHCCQRYSCTLELRNRLERRRSERDQLKARLEFETTSLMRTLRRLKEDFNETDRATLSRAKQEYEDQASKTVRRPKCFCAECAVEHKDRDIASLRKKYQALQAVQQVIADVQKSKGRHMETSP